MADNNCSQCGAPLPIGATECRYCGEPVSVQQAQPVQPQPVVYQQPQPVVYQQPLFAQQPINDGINPSWPIKSKVTAGVLAILLGSIGAHKFYLGKTGMGILYLIFCWTYIPTFLGFIEGIIYLCSNDHNFQVKHECRLQ